MFKKITDLADVASPLAYWCGTKKSKYTKLIRRNKLTKVSSLHYVMFCFVFLYLPEAFLYSGSAGGGEGGGG